VSKYGIREDRFRIIYHGKGEEFASEIDRSEIMRVRAEYNLPEQFIFYPATTLPHKNHVTLLRAMHLLAERKFKYSLVLAGNEFSGYQTLRDCIADLGLRDQVRWLGPVPHKDMPALYHAASLMVFPSRYEGFGLPLNAACLPEIAGEAALLVEHSDAGGMADAIQRALTDTALRGEMVSRGLERAKLFSWENTARGTVEVYQEMAALQREQQLV
jgi:glycosyltransferase involved in cell wall biosynthesis